MRYQRASRKIAPRVKHNRLFGRSVLKLTIFNMLREARAHHEAVASRLMTAKCWST